MAVPNVLTGPGRALDAYSIRARWAPVVLAALPPILLAIALLPGLPTWDKLWSLAGAGAVFILVDQLGRDGGKKRQAALWESWGGAPTTAALRHREATNPVLLARQHQRIAVILGHDLPTKDEELADPVAADHVYQAAINVLIARTRGRRRDYSLIFVENCNYGFRRNMLGLREWGTYLAGATGILAATGIGTDLAGLVRLPPGLMAPVLIVSIIMSVIWRRVVTPDWVRVVACSYAERLIEAAETLTEVT
jgi:hypothetical protein